jgi:hypothetical protein
MPLILKTIFSYRLGIFVGAIIIAAAAYFLFDLKSRVVFYYIFIDLFLSALTLTQVFRAGWKIAVGHVLLSAASITVAYLVFPQIYNLLINH